MGGGTRSLASRFAGAVLLSVAFVAILIAPPSRAQSGRVVLTNPANGQTFDAGEVLTVFGFVVDNVGAPLGGVDLAARLFDGQGRPVPGVEANTTSAFNDGSFLLLIALPSGLAGGTYRLVVDASDVQIVDVEVEIQVRAGFISSALPWIALAMVLAAGLSGVAFLLWRTRPPRTRAPPQ